MKKGIVLLCITLLLCACSDNQPLSEKIAKEMPDAKESMEIELKYQSALLLYGNEENGRSYLVTVHIQEDKSEVIDCIQLNDYYSSIDRNKENDLQIVINRNEKKDKSIVGEIENYKNLVLEQTDYIETENSAKFTYGEDVVIEDHIPEKNQFYFIHIDKDYVELDGTEYKLLDFLSTIDMPI